MDQNLLILLAKDMYMSDGAITILGNNHLTFRGLRFI